MAIPEKEYSLLEYHANTFAGLLLVPPQSLRPRFDAVIDQLQRVGLHVRQMSDVVYDRLLGKLAHDFDVSRGTMERRIEKDQLWNP
jgi:Zn-dependent peptidase ImmA (M78 family)